MSEAVASVIHKLKAYRNLKSKQKVGRWNLYVFSTGWWKSSSRNCIHRFSTYNHKVTLFRMPQVTTLQMSPHCVNQRFLFYKVSHENLTTTAAPFRSVKHIHNIQQNASISKQNTASPSEEKNFFQAVFSTGLWKSSLEICTCFVLMYLHNPNQGCGLHFHKQFTVV